MIPILRLHQYFNIDIRVLGQGLTDSDEIAAALGWSPRWHTTQQCRENLKECFSPLLMDSETNLTMPSMPSKISGCAAHSHGGHRELLVGLRVGPGDSDLPCQCLQNP